MITKAQLKEIKSLQVKKNRVQHQRFLVEGAKSVLEIINSDWQVVTLLHTSDFANKYPQLVLSDSYEKFEVSTSQLESLGTFNSNDQAIAVVNCLLNTTLTIGADEYALVLDDVRDPGNLGTIIRIADWYGIDKIIASNTTAELYNPKVISSTKGSFTRVKMHYTNLEEYLSKYSGTVYGAFMEGDNVHHTKFEGGGLIVMGNESNGISESVGKFISKKLTIPQFGRAESLNVAIATAVICDNLRRT